MTETDQFKTTVRRDVRAFIEDNFLYMQPDFELDDDDELLDQAIIDSLAFVELVEEVQSRYGIEVRDVEINDENFGSVSAIVRFVASRRGA